VRRQQPELRELAAMLPRGADLYAIADLQQLQSNPALRSLLANASEPSRSPEYKAFLDATHFRYETDLRQLALARFGDEWVGMARALIRREPVLSFLKQKATAESRIEGADVYSFGAVRPFRMALLANDLVVFSIGTDWERLAAVIRFASGGGEPALESARDFDHADASAALLPEAGALRIWGQLDRLFPRGRPGPSLGPYRIGSEMLAGARTLRVAVESNPIDLEVRGEAGCESQEAASRIANLLEAFRRLLRPASAPANPSERDLRPVFDALRIQARGNSVLIGWKWNINMLALLLPAPMAGPQTERTVSKPAAEAPRDRRQ